MIGVERGEYHGAVFDATTTTGVFMADGFVVKNCGWTSHDDPQQANGRIVPLEVARQYPLSHPNCRRSSTPRPDITSADQAEHADRLAPETTPVVWDAAVKQYKASTVALSATPARRSTATSMPATIPNTAAGRRFAATLAKHTA